MSAAEHQHYDYPVLVDRAEACAILGVSETTFARLCREGRFENMGGGGLWRSAELRRYRAGDRRRGGSCETVTNSIHELSKSADFGVTSEMKIVTDAVKPAWSTNDTWAICEGCQRRFRPRRAGMRLRENLYFLSHHVFPDTGVPDLSDPEKAGRRLIEEEAEAIGAQLIILDNLSCLCTSGIENDAESWQSTQDWLLKLRRAGYTVLLLHHGGKPDRSGRSRQRDTSKREDVLNTSIMLQPGEDKSTFESEFTKNRGFHPEDAFMVAIGDDGWVRRAETADRDAQILALAAQGLTQRDIAGRVGCSPGLVNKVLQKQRVAAAATAPTVH